MQSHVVMSILARPAAIATTVSSLLGRSKNLRKKYSSAASIDEVIRSHFKPIPGQTKALDLGCGETPRNPFQATELFGVDRRKDLGIRIKQADLSIDPIPFEDNTFQYCTAFDFLEHIPKISWPNGKAKNSFFEVMNEIYRVLKPGGLFMHSTPAFPSKEAFQDPTHVNIITEDTIPDYFCRPNNWGRGYGIGFEGDFELIDQKWVGGIWVVGMMRAIK